MICLTNDGNNVFHRGENVYYNIELKQGVTYCNSFDFKFSELPSSLRTAGIEDWDVAIYASNILTDNSNTQLTPSYYTDLTVLDNSSLLHTHSLSATDLDQWQNICFEFTPDQTYNQYWPIMQPKSGIDITAPYWNHNNNTRLDNFKLTCTTNELVNISWNEVASDESNCLIQFTSTLVDPDLEGIEYLWDFGDDSSLANEINSPNPTHEYSPGVYDVTLTITNRDGCCQTRELTVFCDIQMDYCKYICHEEYLKPGFTCALGVLYDDHNPFTIDNPVFFSQPYDHTDFVGIANEMENRFQQLGYNMMVSTSDPTGNVTCYKSICIGCDGNGIPPQFEVDPITGVPTGVVDGTTIDSTSIWTGNGILVGDFIVNALGDTIWGTYQPAIITFNVTSNIDPNTVVVSPSPNGLGFIIQYEETEGLFAMGDVEVLRVIGNDEFDGVSCDNADVNNPQIETILFNDCP